MDIKTNCYLCKHRRALPFSARTRCTKPDPEMKGHPDGIGGGWFNYPSNFDPVWRIRECNNFEAK